MQDDERPDQPKRFEHPHRVRVAAGRNRQAEFGVGTVGADDVGEIHGVFRLVTPATAARPDDRSSETRREPTPPCTDTDRGPLTYCRPSRARPARDEDHDVRSLGGERCANLTGMGDRPRAADTLHVLNCRHALDERDQRATNDHGEAGVRIGAPDGVDGRQRDHQIPESVVTNDRDPANALDPRSGSTHLERTTDDLGQPDGGHHVAADYNTRVRPTLILFDVDGTLIDTAGAGRRAMERAFVESFGTGSLASMAHRVPFAGRTDPSILRELAAAAGVPADRFDAEREGIVSRYLDHLRHEMQRPDPRRKMIPGVRILLDALADRRELGVRVGLLTGNFEIGARLKLEAFGLNAYFAGGGFSSDHADRREIARLARLRIEALERMTFPVERVAVVGDTEHDVDCARANGFRAVAVNSGWVSRDCLDAAAPDALLDDFTDLSGALAALDVP